MSTKPRLTGERGFTLVEMLVASMIMITVTAGVVALVNPAQGTFRAQPEVSDLQQRLRVGVDTLMKDLVMAGAGTYAGSAAGALYNFFAPVMPYRTGLVNDDPAAGVFFRPDAISLTYVPTTASQTTLRDQIPVNAQELQINDQANCPPNKPDQLCGFSDGMRALIFSPSGAWDPVTITDVQDPTLHFQYAGNLSTAYGAGAHITQVQTQTYYLKNDTKTNTHHLMHYDGYKSDLPVVDNVVKLGFQYFGDPQPPMLLPGTSLTDTVGPFTTYGPRPPVAGVDNTSDSWPAGENCAFQIQAGRQVSRLPVLAAGLGQVALPSSLLTDGPWCPDAEHTNRFDADLLRIRRVRVKLRVQVTPASMRGPRGVLFVHGGTATARERFVPDEEISFDITPRNMNLGR